MANGDLSPVDAGRAGRHRAQLHQRNISGVPEQPGDEKGIDGLGEGRGMSIKNLVEMIKHNGLLASIYQLDELYRVAIDNEQELADSEAKCAALAAENAGLKAVCEDRRAFIMNGVQLGYIQVPTVETDPALETIRVAVSPQEPTPVTDAFLAEVRAQAWIEGNVPAEFGRYWVRYETDVGPQYCSAKWMEHNFCAGSDTNIHKIWLADHSRSINSLKGVTHYTMLPEPIEGGAK